jgi:hypothetical protein
MIDHLALQPSALEPSRARLAALDLQLAEYERDLARDKTELHELQSRYLREIGGLHEQLARLQVAVEGAEIRAGIRPPPSDDIAGQDEADESNGRAEAISGCSNPPPPDDLKRIFRDIAKAIHPDRAHDDHARFRRHSLMAEANRAYADRDEDRLRLIMRTWQRSSESVVGDDPESERLRVLRRVAETEARLAAIDVEFADLRASAIWRLRAKIEETRAQGWDLFAEMVMQVKAEVARATARLITLERSA